MSKEQSVEIFRIIVTTFDSMENRIGSAVCNEDLGLVVTKEKAIEIVEGLTELYGGKYKGWDDQMYPKYSFKETSRFSIYKLNQYGTSRIND